MSITITGPLLRAPEVRTTGVDDTVVIWSIRTPGLHVEVRRPYGSGPGARALAELAVRGVQPGDVVTAVGNYITPRFDHGEAVQCLREVESLTVVGRQG